MKRTLGWVGLVVGLPLTMACSGGDPTAKGGAEGPLTGRSEDGVEQESERGGRHHRHHRDPAKFIARFDKNGDGVLEVAELPEKLQRFVGKADANGDGKLTVDELKAHAAAKREEHWKKRDKNGDGALEASEVPPAKWEHLKVADANSDGKVTKDEIKEAKKNGKLRRSHGPHGGPDGAAPESKDHGG